MVTICKPYISPIQGETVGNLWYRGERRLFEELLSEQDPMFPRTGVLEDYGPLESACLSTLMSV